MTLVKKLKFVRGVPEICTIAPKREWLSGARAKHSRGCYPHSRAATAAGQLFEDQPCISTVAMGYLQK